MSTDAPNETVGTLLTEMIVYAAELHDIAHPLGDPVVAKLLRTIAKAIEGWTGELECLSRMKLRGQERLLDMVARRRAGQTLKEVGAAHGVSANCVRLHICKYESRTGDKVGKHYT